MTKKEAAALCALIVASTSAPAWAQMRDVVLYGTVDLGVRRASGLTPDYAPSNGTQNSLNSGVGDASRWGLRGIEPISRDLNIAFDIEAGVRADTGDAMRNGPFFDRASWVGLQGSWGRAAAGRQTTLLTDSFARIDPMQQRFPDLNPNMTIAALARHGLGEQFGNTGLNLDSSRLNNALKYSGSFEHTNVGLMHSFGEQDGNRSPLSSSGALLGWNKDGLDMALAYQRFRSASDGKLAAWTMGAAYQWDNMRLATTYARQRADLADASRTTQHVYSLGGTWSADPYTDYTLAWYKVERDQSASGVSDGYRRVMALIEQKLARRTVMYTGFDITDWSGGYEGLGNRSRAKGITVGMRYSF